MSEFLAHHCTVLNCSLILLLGDAFVILKSEDDAVQALGRHKANIGERYVEVFRSTGAELHQVNCLLQDAKNE